MGNAVDRSNSYVANATGKPIRIFYSVDRLRLEEMVVNMKAGVEVSMEAASMSASGDMKSVFKLDSRHRFVRIPVGSFVQIAGRGAVYASVFVESSSNSNDCKDTITLNFHIPCDRSFIVTKDHSIRFQKYGDSIWVDDQGIRHG